MPSPNRERVLRPGDRLLRKLNAGTWNPKSFEVFPEAFHDQHDDLSFFVERFLAPREVLAYFAGFRGLRRHYFGNLEHRGPEELWEKGIGIGVIAFEAMFPLGLEFKTYKDGRQVNKNGHVEAVGGKRMMLELSRLARPLSYLEIFPVSH